MTCERETENPNDPLCRIAVQWELEDEELARLLRDDGTNAGNDGKCDNEETEIRRMLLIDLAAALDAQMPPRVLVEWLRDDPDGNGCALDFMAGGSGNIRALLIAARTRP